MVVSDRIYKRDSAGKVRVWFYEVDGGSYRTSAGLLDGQQVVSAWTVCSPKSQATSHEQALFEANAEMTKKLERDYHRDIANIDTALIFEPMLAQTYGKATPFPVFCQPKLDGIRCIATANGLFSRQGKRFYGVPHIENSLVPLFDASPDLILDGELYNHDLKDDFNQIVSIVKKQNPSAEQLVKSAELVQYHVYDVPSHPGTFSNRWSAFCNLDPNPDPELNYLPGIKAVETRVAVDQAQLNGLYHGWIEAGYEGQMVRLNGVYENKRSKNLLKRKEFVDAEFPIVAIEEGLGNWAGYAKRIVCRLPDGREFGAGVKGTQAFTKELLARRGSLIGKDATVKFFAYTPDGVPRFPVAIQFDRIG